MLKQRQTFFTYPTSASNYQPQLDTTAHLLKRFFEAMEVKFRYVLLRTAAACRK